MFKFKNLVKRILPGFIWKWFVNIKTLFSVYRNHRKMRYKIVKNSKELLPQTKCKILFIVQRAEVFNSVKSVFISATQNPNCDVYLLPIPRFSDVKNQIDMDSYPSVYNFCCELGRGTVINSLDEKTNSFIPIDKIKPHYIFLNVPYTNRYPEEYYIEKLSNTAKVCFVPYAYTLGNVKLYKQVYDTQYNLSLMAYTDKIFVDGKTSYKLCNKYMWLSQLIHGKRLFNLGFPRFDMICEEEKRKSIKKVLWIPRWTTLKQKNFFGSTFFEYKDKIFDFVERNNLLEFIIRPHPIAFENYVKEGFMTEEEVLLYKDKITNSHGVKLDDNENYIETFKEADVLIADYSSIIIEFFLLAKPIIYTGQKKDFDPNLSYITDTFYFSDSWGETEQILDMLCVREDPHKEARILAVNRFKQQCGNSGERILTEILNGHFAVKK